MCLVRVYVFFYVGIYLTCTEHLLLFYLMIEKCLLYYCWNLSKFSLHRKPKVLLLFISQSALRHGPKSKYLCFSFVVSFFCLLFMLDLVCVLLVGIKLKWILFFGFGILLLWIFFFWWGLNSNGFCLIWKKKTSKLTPK